MRVNLSIQKNKYFYISYIANYMKRPTPEMPLNKLASVIDCNHFVLPLFLINKTRVSVHYVPVANSVISGTKIHVEAAIKLHAKNG